MPNSQFEIRNSKFLMCRPTYYTIAYEINPWMSLKRQTNHARAVVQWNRLYQVLAKELGARIELLAPHRGVPDLVFTANVGLVHGRTLIRSNFRHPERQKEEPIIERYFRGRRYRIFRLSPHFDFEGEGDALWMNETLVFGFRFRSDAPAHEELARILKAEVLPVELIDKRFYHLDTCFCPLDGRTVMWYPNAFDRYGRKVIEGLAEDVISVSEKDATRFVCNAIVIRRSIVVQAGLSTKLTHQLTRRGFRLFPVDLSEFLKAGGSAKCLVLGLDSRRRLSDGMLSLK